MHIVCPHCTTSYAVNPATFGVAGRNVRCSRCKEVWLARPEDATKLATAPAEMAEAGVRGGAGHDSAAEWGALSGQEEGEGTPMVDSPSISSDWPVEDEAEANWATDASDELDDAEFEPSRKRSRLSRLFRGRETFGGSGNPFVSLSTACAAMGALVLALVIWRADVVRLLPQTAAFYRMVSLEVNVRSLTIKEVKISSEMVEGKPVLVIEGFITGRGAKPIDLPRLRFSVRDAQGAEIYAWNAVLERPVLNPGERAWFKSRLASPPPEGHDIDIRFFTKRDLVGGKA
jgi:predicted Zn finger-like uncharacterized protein